jgi:hypothetical protein
VAHSSGSHFGCNIGEPGGVFQWPTQVVVILSAILVNWVGYLSGPPKGLTFWVQYQGTGDMCTLSISMKITTNIKLLRRRLRVRVGE